MHAVFRRQLRFLGVVFGVSQVLGGHLTPAWAQSIEVQVAVDSDDAEESDGGTVNLNDTKLNLGQERWVGLRFNAVSIPQGAMIVSAYFEMRASDNDSGNADLTVFGEDVDDAAVFSSGGSNLSSRPTTSASATWSISSNWKKNQWYDSPDIAMVVQEIVDRSGWADGNDLVILVRSDNLSGHRRAFSHDDNKNKACKLHVVYSPGPTLVSRWTFDDGAGSVVTDSQSAGNNGSVLGSYLWQTKCDGDGYLDLNSASTYVNVPADSSLNFSGDASVTGWFRLNSAFDSSSTSSQVLLEKFSSNNENLHVVLAGTDYTNTAVADGSLVFKINGSAGAYEYVWTNQTTWDASKWYHLAAVLDSNTPANNKVYVDGVDDTAGADGPNTYSDMSFSAPINIGGRTAEDVSGDRYLDGQVNDFRIYDYQLSPTEVSDLYGLVAHWNLDETSGSTAADSSANGLDATLSGGVTWATGLIDGCLSFDGSNGEVVNNNVGTNLNGADAVTVALWVKSNAINVDSDLFDTQASANYTDDGLSLRYDQNGQTAGGTSLVKGAIGTTAGVTSFESSSNVQTTSWQHLALVWYSGSDPVLYVNGQPDVLADYGDVLGGTINGIDRFIFGVGAMDAHWDGLVDDVRIYSRALCQDEIQDLASSSPSEGVRIIRWVEAR